MSEAIQDFSIISDFPRPMAADGGAVSAPCHPVDAPAPESIPDGPDLPDFPAPAEAASTDPGCALSVGLSGATPPAGDPDLTGDSLEALRKATPEELNQISRLLEGVGQPQPPELPEVKACRRLLQAAHSTVINSMLTVCDLQDKGQLARYEHDVRSLYSAASLLIYEMHKAHGSSFMPPQLPQIGGGRAL